MMYKRFALLLLVLVLFSCKGDVMSQKTVERVACQYYTYLVSGNYEAFVDATYRPMPLRESHREELVANAKMFGAANKVERVDAVRTEVDMRDSTATAFLRLTYEDGREEVVALPMVCRRGVWYMK